MAKNQTFPNHNRRKFGNLIFIISKTAGKFKGKTESSQSPPKKKNGGLPESRPPGNSEKATAFSFSQSIEPESCSERKNQESTKLKNFVP